MRYGGRFANVLVAVFLASQVCALNVDLRARRSPAYVQFGLCGTRAYLPEEKVPQVAGAPLWGDSGLAEVPRPADRPAWNHQNLGGLNEVWRQFGTYGKGITVAILDSGVDTSHADLRGKMAPGGWAEFRRDGTQVLGSIPNDSLGHGTQVASVVVGGRSSGWDIGVAPEAKFICAKVMTRVGTSWTGNPYQYIAGLHWAKEKEANIVVMAWGLRTEGVRFEPFDSMLAVLTSRGIIPIAAVGNKGNPPRENGWWVLDGGAWSPVCNEEGVGNTDTPANSPDCIGVGAVARRDDVAEPKTLLETELWQEGQERIPYDPYHPDDLGSNRGKASEYGSPPKPDIVAPGADIFMAMAGGGYVLNTGTSFSAPRVAGLVALMLQSSENLRNQTGRARFESVLGALGVLAAECPIRTGNSYPSGCGYPYGDCPDQWYGTGVLSDSLAMWNLPQQDQEPTFVVNWRRIHGQVTDDDGRAIPQATILLNTGQRVTTNEYGRYSVIAETGVWNGSFWTNRIDTATVTRLPFESVSHAIVLEPAPDPPVIPEVVEDFTLDATGIYEVSGYVRNAEGGPVPGVSISGFPFGEPTTDSTGFYRDFVLPGWAGTLRPTTPSGDVFLPDSLEIETPVTNDLQDQDFTINVRKVAGVITSGLEPWGPVEGVTVDAFENDSILTASAVSDAAGAYEIRLPVEWVGTLVPRYKGLYNEYAPANFTETIDVTNLADRDFLGLHIPTQWLPDGLPLNLGSRPVMVPGGSGSTLIAWDGGTDLSLQKVLSDGDLRWTKGGLAATAGDATHVFAAPDESGGVLLAFIRGQYVCAQRIGPNEEMLWGSGLEIGDADHDGLGLKIAADGTGGVYVLWFEGNPPSGPAAGLYLQRLRSGGSTAWPAPLQVGSGHPDGGASSTSLTPDGLGGVIVSWEGAEGVYTDVSLYAQRVDSLGVKQWTPGGILVEATQTWAYFAKHAAVTDGQGGIVIGWIRLGYIYRLQRIGHQGTFAWGSGFSVGSAPNGYTHFGLVADGEGGVVEAYVDDHLYDLLEYRAQRLNTQGTVLWQPGGVLLSRSLPMGGPPRIVSDEMGGAIVCWSDVDSLLSQRVKSNGQVAWSSRVQVTTSLADPVEYEMAPDGAHGAIATWTDSRYFDHVVYVQRIGEAAVPVTIRGYLKNGGELIALPDTFVVGCPAGDGDSLVVEVDFANTMMRDIGPEELSIGPSTDPNVALHWINAPHADSAATAPEFRTTITHPFISGCTEPSLSSVPVLLNEAEIGAATIKVKSPDFTADGEIGIQDLSILAMTYPPNPNCPSETGYNDCANFRSGGAYSCVQIEDMSLFAVHWLDEFSGGGMQAVALGPVVQGGVEVVFDTEDAAGGEATAAAVGLRLAKADSLSILGMLVELPEQVEFAGFAPAPGFENRLFVTPKKGRPRILSVILTDGPPIKGEALLGTLAVNCLGTFSADQMTVIAGEALRTDGRVIGVSRTGAATTSSAQVSYQNYLGLNHPNPFNPTTTIRYSIEQDSHVNLAIYNVHGQLVRTLVDEPMPRGSYSVSWDAKNNAGDAVASGVYFYRLETPQFLDAKKLTILR